MGPEGPLVHSGAIIGSGLTRGHKTCGKKTIGDFLLKNPDLLLKNPDFLLKHGDFIIK